MGYVPVQYYQSFGKCDSSEPIDWEIELTDEEQKIYDAEIKRIKEAIVADNPELSIDEVELSDDDLNFYEFDSSKLSDALNRVALEIAEYEATEYDNEECREALGYNEMDEDELCELVKARDPYTIAYFHLENATNEELEDWYPDEVPMVCEFKKDFVPDEAPITVYFVAGNVENDDE